MEKRSLSAWRTVALVLACATVVLAVCLWRSLQKNPDAGLEASFGDEMKMPVAYDYDDQGANAYARKGDHPDSPYFYKADFYHMTSTDSRTILPHFKTYQQTAWFTCGIAVEMMVMNYYGQLGDWNEKSLADLRTDHSDIHIGTCLDQMLEMFEKAGGWSIESTYDYKDNPDAIDLAFLERKLKEGKPIIVGWNDWGGHWVVIIGYDEMDTPDDPSDDVLIIADSFDTTDHNQDGYGVVGAQRFIYNFTFFDYFKDPAHARDRCFLIASPQSQSA